MHPSAQPLTKLQREIMEVVWKQGEVSVSEVRTAMATKRARNTVLTIMTRLERKGWLQSRSEGRKLLFSSPLPREASLGARVVQLIDGFFGGSAEKMVATLLNHRGLNGEELKRIQAMLKEQQGKPKKKRGAKR